MKNLSAIVWLYRGQQGRFLALVRDYLRSVCTESASIPATLTTFETTLVDLQMHFTNLIEAVEKHTQLDGDKKQALSDVGAELLAATMLYETDRAKLLADLDSFPRKFANALLEANDQQLKA